MTISTNERPKHPEVIPINRNLREDQGPRYRLASRARKRSNQFFASDNFDALYSEMELWSGSNPGVIYEIWDRTQTEIPIHVMKDVAAARAKAAR